MFRSPDRLFRRYRETGEPRLLGRVFDLTAPELLRVALHLTRDRHAAEDALQATFLSAIEKRAQWDAERPLLPWLLAILANHARQAFRRERRELPPRSEGAASDAAEVAATAELARACEAALDALEEPYRPVLVLHLRHGLAAHEIAATLARPDSTVRNQIARGLDLLRRKLPAGVAGAMAFASLPGRGLAAVRGQVLAAAPPSAAVAPAAAAIGGAAVLGLGGLLMAKNVAVALLALVAIGGFGWWSVGAFEAAVPQASAPAVPSLALATSTPTAPPASDEVAATREAVAVPGPATTGGLVVEVVDRAGAPVAAAACSVVRVGARGLRRPVAEAITDDAGLATFSALQPGDYEAVFDAHDRREDCAIAAGREGRVRIQLREGVACSGIVVDREGRPVAGAEVRCEGDWHSTVVARSRADGTFLAPYAPARVMLWATAPGRQPSKRQGIEAGPSLRFVLGDAGAAFAGRVVDEHGAPVANARVFVGMDMRAGSPFRILERHDLRADAAGVFAVDWARPGAIVVVALPADCDAERASWRELQLDAGGPAPTLRLELGDGATVTGTVRDERGAALAGVAVDSWSRDIGMGPFDRARTETDAAGAFVLRGLWPCEQRLSARRGSGESSTEGELVLESRRRHTWDPVLADGAPIVIRVVDSTGAPVGRSQLSISRGTRDLDYAFTDADGRHRWEHLAPGGYTVRVLGAGYAAVIAERTLAPGSQEVEIRIDAAKLPSARVSGRVVDGNGQPVPGADVALHGGGQFRAPQRVDTEGRFTSERLPPGQWSLSASGRGHGLGWVGRVLQLAVGQEFDLGDVVLPATASLLVRVRGPDGVVVRDATVAFEVSSTSMPADELDGAHRAVEVQPGKHLLQVHGAAIVPQRIELTLMPGERREFDVLTQAAVPIVLEFHFAKQRPDDNGLVHAQLDFTSAAGERVLSLRPFGYFTDFAQRMHRIPLGLAPGNYRLAAKEFGGRTVDVALEVPAAPPKSPIVIDMR